MRYQDFNLREHGFVGHLVEPDASTASAVIIISGGEKSVLPGVKLAETFATHGIAGLAVSLFGAEGLPAGPSRVPVDMFEPAIAYLRERRHMERVSTYGMSMGSIFALLAARLVGNVDNVVLCSPTHVPFEGSLDKVHMDGCSVATWRGEDIPYVPLDLSTYKAGRYYYDEEAGRKVLGTWRSYRDAYHDEEAVAAADMHIEELDARVLLVAGTADEAWPSSYSVGLLERRLAERGYPYEHRALVYERASHLIGIMPERERNPWLWRTLPLVGLMYRSLNTNREECLRALEDSQQQIITFVR